MKRVTLALVLVCLISIIPVQAKKKATASESDQDKGPFQSKTFTGLALRGLGPGLLIVEREYRVQGQLGILGTSRHVDFGENGANRRRSGKRASIDAGQRAGEAGGGAHGEVDASFLFVSELDFDLVELLATIDDAREARRGQGTAQPALDGVPSGVEPRELDVSPSRRSHPRVLICPS